MKELTEPYKCSVEKVLQRLKVSPETGLTEEDVRERTIRFGKNLLKESKPKSPLLILADQFKSLIVLSS